MTRNSFSKEVSRLVIMCSQIYEIGKVNVEKDIVRGKYAPLRLAG
jgi:hypothetical protein